jgi:hypothetical protein
MAVSKVLKRERRLIAEAERQPMKESEMNQTLVTGEAMTEKSGAHFCAVLGKVHYADKSEATAQAQSLNKRRNKTGARSAAWRAYRCSTCCGWHVGRDKRPATFKKRKFGDFSDDTKNPSVSMNQTPYNREGEV